MSFVSRPGFACLDGAHGNSLQLFLRKLLSLIHFSGHLYHNEDRYVPSRPRRLRAKGTQLNLFLVGVGEHPVANRARKIMARGNELAESPPRWAE
jgi:hypothetical protein